jgi:hypothetical protein
MPAQNVRKASVTSLRIERKTTHAPAHAIRNPKNAVLPHCPGETQTRSVANIMAMMATFVGLKTCLPLTRTKNFEAMAITAAARSSATVLLRRSSDSESAEIVALFHSNAIPRSFEQANCVSSAVARIAATRNGVTSKCMTVMP